METPRYPATQPPHRGPTDRERAEAVLKKRMGDAYRYLRPTERDELVRSLLRAPRRDRIF